jgi:hypothetical protein
MALTPAGAPCRSASSSSPAPRSSCPRRAGATRTRPAASSLDPPLHETFAFIRRRNARLSPATRARMTLAEEHLAALTG